MKEKHTTATHTDYVIVGDENGRHLELSAHGVTLWRQPDCSRLPAASLTINYEGHVHFTLYDGMVKVVRKAA